MPATINVHDAAACAPPASTPRERARRRLKIAAACFVVLHAGRVAPRAGIDTAILGVARLRQRHGVDGVLIVAGGPDVHAELARLRQLARVLGMEPHVRFTCDASGNTALDVHGDCFAAADVLASISWGDASAGDARAAMACALPVIGTIIDGQPGVVRDEVTGYLIPVRDAEALTERLAQLQRLPGLAQAMGEAGRAHLVNLDLRSPKAPA